jgi:hypothetical protein
MSTQRERPTIKVTKVTITTAMATVQGTAQTASVVSCILLPTNSDGMPEEGINIPPPQEAPPSPISLQANAGGDGFTWTAQFAPTGSSYPADQYYVAIASNGEGTSISSPTQVM